jgi:hypothetical protein
MPEKRRTALAAAVLLLPAAVSLPGTVRDEIGEIVTGPGLRYATVETAAPFMYGDIEWPPDRRIDHSLVLVAKRVVPPEAEIGVRNAGTSWARRVAFALAPRLIVEDTGQSWLILRRESPAEAGVSPRRSWRFGSFWLVER